MTKEEKESWEKRYSSPEYEPRRKPSDLLAKWVGLVRPGKALDLACGTGRHSLFLAERGFEVTAVDISEAAIEIARKSAAEKGVNIKWIAADLDSYKIRGKYDIIISFFYVNKNMAPDIIEALKKGGILIFESHMVPPASSSGSSAPDTHRFRFQPGELRQLFPGLKVLQYEERPVEEEGNRHSYLASLVARKE